MPIFAQKFGRVVYLQIGFFVIEYDRKLTTERTERTSNDKMTNRRLISKMVIYSDKFSELPLEAQRLYLYMILEADDDGFIGHMRQVLMISDSDRFTLEMLIKAGFVIEFKSRVCVITHWRMHNSIDRSGYSPTEFVAERAQVYLDDQLIYAPR